MGFGALDFITGLPGITDIATGISDFFGGNNNPFNGDNGLFSNPTGAWDKFKNGETNSTNQAIAKENLAYQRERAKIEDERYAEETAYNRAFAEDERDYQRAFAEDERDYQREFAENERDYQRQLQQQIFDREDTAIERQANSLSKLGINPLSQNMNGLGAGQAVSASSAGASTPGTSSAPSASSRGGQALHNDYQHQDIGVLQALQPLMSMFQGASDMMTGSITRDGLREQNDYQRLLNQEKEIENSFKYLELDEKIKNMKADTENKKSNTKTTDEMRPSQVLNSQATAERNQRENVFQSETGVTDNTNNYVRLITDIEKQAENPASQVFSAKNKAMEARNNALKTAYNSVSKALSNTIGRGAKAIFDTFSRQAEKAKKRSEETKTYYYDENGKRRRIYNTYVDDRL